jgi:hypothetical protein
MISTCTNSVSNETKSNTLRHDILCFAHQTVRSNRTKAVFYLFTDNNTNKISKC